MKVLLGKNRSYRLMPRAWPRTDKRLLGWLLPVELVMLVPVLVIFGIAQPDLYRTAMWRIGFENKLNSNPNMILYAYANHRPLPDVPFIWSSTLTSFNVAISIVSLFFLLIKLIAYIMRTWYPVFAVFVNTALVALAAASLAVTLLLLIVYLVNLAIALHATWPNPENHVCTDDDEDVATLDSKERGAWEMHSMKAPISTPYTPRTQAFYTLDRQLPLRQHDQPYA
ncbi:hypothetical protein XA68_12766 [Ophiocordyceps unilateralis]|uniref:Uncharacterized protein n=1 Tax=Ophiocordyceps unilateralis TaxID=268505 RepID=A0A2A9PE71_OPHUN|nr:hypothetical protein XA68_12766 [Ophiocordyceps unilateralis]